MFRSVAILSVAVVVLASCGGGGAGGDAGSGGGHEGHAEMEAGGGEHSVSFGHAGDPGDASREIEVEATDRLAFEPAELEVSAGDTVTFVVTNSGKLPHEFVLGDEAYQDEHAEGMSMDHDEGNGVSLEPGATQELTWTFTDAGEVIYGCHVDGHYAGGMRGVVTVR